MLPAVGETVEVLVGVGERVTGTVKEVMGSCNRIAVDVGSRIGEFKWMEAPYNGWHLMYYRR